MEAEDTRRTRSRFDSRDLAVRAVRVLDSDGLTALTMRRMASEMGVATTSSLYWRVRNKDDLLRLAVDEVFAQAVEDAATLDLGDLAGHALTVLSSHSWCPPLIPTHAGTGPGYLAYAEHLLRALRAAGVEPPRQGAALSAIGFYVIGAAQQLSAWRAAGSPMSLPEAAPDTHVSSFLSASPLDVEAHVQAGLDLVLRAVLEA